MDVEYKIMYFSELARTVSLCNLCFEENTKIEEAEEIYKNQKGSDKDIYLIGILNSEVVASLKITIVETIYKGLGTYAILNHICVQPDYRRQKIGTNLLSEAFRICRLKDVHAVSLWSLTTRHEAHLFYDSLGFSKDEAKFFIKSI